MELTDLKAAWKTMSLLLRSHPWHGIPVGEDAPTIVNTYIETVPTDTVKYEIDKESGFLKVDRPQKFSSICPTLYGFIPQTYCGSRIADFCNQHLNDGRSVVGDDDPLDICVLTEKAISHGDIMIQAVPIGGFRMLDHGQADDKIIAVMKNDTLYRQWNDVSDCPPAFIDRLRHYFLTYKDLPGEEKPACEITHTYGREEAFEVIRRSREDYKDKFGPLAALMDAIKK